MLRRFIPAGAGNTVNSAFNTSATAVHPRGRGEHGPRNETQSERNGSSPRARGTRLRHSQRLFQRRFIPAGAGNTLGRICMRRSRPVHPRGRGEHARAPKLLARQIRFIPAGAGNTKRTARRRTPGTVHPRGRGEHCWGRALGQGCFGSSPRARGTPGSRLPRPVW